MFICNQLTVDISSQHILRSITFEVNHGTICAVLGPNAAGKSTLLKALSGLLLASAGDVSINGVSLKEKRRSFLSAIGVLPEDFGLFDNLTVLENLLTCGPMYGLDRRTTRIRADRLVNLLGLFPNRSVRVNQCSYGTKKKAALALALLHDPQILMLDEPFESLDPSAASVVRSVFQTLARRGRTILFTSHIIEIVAQVADEVIILANGQLVSKSNRVSWQGSLGQVYFANAGAQDDQDLTWL